MATIISRSCPVNPETLKSNRLRRRWGRARAEGGAGGTFPKDSSRSATKSNRTSPRAKVARKSRIRPIRSGHRAFAEVLVNTNVSKHGIYVQTRLNNHHVGIRFS